MQIDNRLKTIASNHPYPLLFASISGAHLYGFPSPDSDFDLRGVHILPLEHVLGIDAPEETITVDEQVEGLHLDLVTHDVKFYFTRLLTRNGSLLDQIFSPLVVVTSPEHNELRKIARQCVTTQHSHHYLGLAASQWKLFEKHDPRRVKPLLYVYRALLCGIHLMHTGEVESNLRHLNEIFSLPYIDELIEQKVSGVEQATLTDTDIVFHEKEYERLQKELEQASQTSELPESLPDKPRSLLNNLLLRLRFANSSLN
jgi:predicted nucleotidyltransferase